MSKDLRSLGLDPIGETVRRLNTKRPLSLRAGLFVLPLLLSAAPALAQMEPAPVAPAAPGGGSELSSVLPSAGQ
ncbi:MAG TPA: hypothetical protein VGF45_05390, partial [Polyangia bacterium]